MNCLVDTSVWSLSLRRARRDLNPLEHSVVAELTELIAEGRARLVGLIRQEVLSGIRNPAQFDRLRAALRAFPDEVLNTEDYEAAAQASIECKARGVTVSVVDALICAVALTRDWTVFTADTDFERHVKIIPIKLHSARR